MFTLRIQESGPPISHTQTQIRLSSWYSYQSDCDAPNKLTIVPETILHPGDVLFIGIVVRDSGGPDCEQVTKAVLTVPPRGLIHLSGLIGSRDSTHEL